MATSGIINDGDVVLALSYSGESEELINLLPALKRFVIKIIAFTGSPKSSLAHHSDIVLNARVPKEACPFNLAPTASTTAMLVWAMRSPWRCCARADSSSRILRGCIPRVQLAERCFPKVRDIMRTGERNAVAQESFR